jgi:hypothetical protein
VADCLELARSKMRRYTGFNANDARWQFLEEPQRVSALDLAAKQHFFAASTPCT